MILTGGEITSLKSGLIVMNKKYLLDDHNLQLFKKKIEAAENLLLFLDYDGTLAPFKADPLSACALPQIEKTLSILKRKNNYYLNLVSGRKLSELKDMLHLKEASYAGSHGLEIELSFEAEVIYPYQTKSIDTLSQKNYDRVKKDYQDLEGIKVEDKGFGLALHFETLEKQKEHQAKLESLFSDSAYQLLSGREVIEIRPAGWDKGKAVDYMTQRIKENYGIENTLRIYIGDDRTDEDAFRILNDGLSIYVQNDSNLKTEAEYYLKDPEDTAKLLKVLAGDF